jgi:hypothetical protein
MRPTLEQIKCVHTFRPSADLPADQWLCVNGCGGIQTQLEPCNGNCRCGEE